MPKKGDKAVQERADDLPFPGSPAEAAQYIADMTGGLKAIAASSNMKFLAYLLEMASEEAFNEAARMVPERRSASNE